MNSLPSTSYGAIDSIPGVPDVTGWLDPFQPMSVAFRAAYKMVVDTVMGIIASPPRVSDSPSVIEYYKVALAPASFYAWVILVYAMCVAIFVWVTWRRVIHALVVFILTIALSPIYLTLMDTIMGIGDAIAAALASVFSGMTSPAELPSIEVPLLDVISFGFLVLSALFALVFLVSADFLYALMVFALPLTFAVSAMGPRTQNAFNAVLSIALVLSLFSRAISIAVIGMFQVALVYQPRFNSTLITNMVTSASFLFAVCIQVALIVVTYMGVKKIQGNVGSYIRRSTGQIKAAVVNMVKVQQDTSGPVQPARPMPVVVVSQPQTANDRRNQSRHTRNNVLVGGAAIAAAAAARNPSAGVKVYTAGKTAQKFVESRHNKGGNR